jgi:hypothetical protein
VDVIMMHSANRHPSVHRALVPVGVLVAATIVLAQYPAGPQVTKDGTRVLLQDYVALPISSRTVGTYPSPIDFAGQLGRVNFLRSEPPSASQSALRFFVNDLNRNLYILDKATKTFTSYINFEEVFGKFDNDPGLAGGLVTFAFDPEYATNGTIYTVHTEDPGKTGSAIPVNSSLPGLDLSGGYTTTAAVNPPAGSVVRQAVLVEWTDTNPGNGTFEGTARELLRVGFNANIHPLGDLVFNPLAVPGHADYGNIYLSVGDGAAGETSGATRTIPQRLDTLQGKILRITPDLDLRPADPLGPNGRYRIPTTGTDPNPFVSLSLSGVRKEIYAYGLRNPHRMSWDPVSDKLIVAHIGLHSWETVTIVSKGANFGYSEREGTEQLFVGGLDNGRTGSQISPPVPFPSPDLLTVDGLAAPVTPNYPVTQYSHRDGDAISSGFVYRGSLVPELYGKFVFGDITTGRLFYADIADMIANDDGNRTSLAAMHELQVVFDSPYDVPDQGAVNRRMFDIVAAEYTHKGGDAPGSNTLPGNASVTAGSDPDGVPYGGGRADIRIALGGDGEIYVLSKTDGMIRRMLATTGPVPPTVTIAATDATATEAGTTTATFTVSRTGSTASQLSIGYVVTGSATAGSDYTALSGSVTIPAASASATITVTPIDDALIEPNEMVVVTLSASANYSVGTPGNASATIVSDDGTPPAPLGLIAAYGFDEGTGTGVTDASGSGNPGTISGAAWTTSGRFGSALSFDGVNDWVTIADSNSLDLTSALTLEAWIYPTALTGWRTVLMKEVSGGMAYTLYADTTSHANVYLKTTGGDAGQSAPAVLPLSTWTHVAATYDTTTMRLYVNGTQVATRARTGNITTSTSPLHIGGNTPWGEWFAGRIDEVRIYNRVLTAAQITTDMNTAVGSGGPPPPDTTPPIVAMSGPATGPVAGVVTLAATASDSGSGVAGVRFLINGAIVGVEDASSPYSVQWDTRTLADAQYSATAIARDAGTNEATSAPRLLTVDNTGPQVAIVPPAADPLTGIVSIGATAADTSGVASVQLQVDGVHVGSPDTSSPYSLSWDTRTATNGAHQLTALATDILGNQRQSSMVSVNVSNSGPPPPPPIPPGLVAAYGFNEGLGTSVADASGNGNLGTIAGATWTVDSKFGQALSFDGNDRVNINDSNSLDLTTGMTLEAWIKPSASSTVFTTVILKERPGGLAYAQYVDSTTHANVYVNVGGEAGVSSPAVLPLNVWTHVAVTFDGAMMRVFVNGAQVATRARSGSLLVSTGALRIGGNAIWTAESFRGVIDEVRIYNRALSATEILADMAAAIQ